MNQEPRDASVSVAGGETLFDGVLHRDTYEPLISEEGEPIPNADPAPVRQ